VNTLFFKLVLAVALSLAISLPGFADPKAQSTPSDIAKQLHNPLSNLKEVIFQLDVLPDVGPDGKTDWVQTIQPVYPFALNNAVAILGPSGTRLVFADLVYPACGKVVGMVASGRFWGALGNW
jgi:hypothetical protein